MEYIRLILSGVGYPLLLTTIIQTGMSLPNLALNGLAKQSSTIRPGDYASRANDGIEGTWSHTEKLKKFLILCEVEVYGCAADPPPPTVNLMLGGRNVTLVGAGLCWSDALFYCRDHHWDLLSLTSRGQQTELEVLLQEDISFPLTPHLWLGLRRYLMEDKWFWMNGDHMTYSQWKWGYAPPRLSHPCGAVANGGDFLWEDRLCEEHLNFLCISGTEQKDRVTFYSSDRDKPHCP